MLILSNIIYKHNNKSILSQYNKNGEVIIYLKVYRNKINNTRSNLKYLPMETQLLYKDVFSLNNNSNPLYKENIVDYSVNLSFGNKGGTRENSTFAAKAFSYNNISGQRLNKDNTLNILLNLLNLCKLDTVYNNNNIFNNYIEYYLIKIYNKIVKLKIIELSNPSLSPYILGENIKILFSKGIGVASAKEIMN